jgi:hypothetical protein
MTYVYIHYIPGAAGNFLSRALSLCTGVYGDVPTNTTIDDLIALTAKSKMEFLSYNGSLHATSATRSPNTDQWSRHEKTLIQTSALFPVEVLTEELSENSAILRHGHNSATEQFLYDFAGKDDTEFNVLIDVAGMFEWLMCNALYKNLRPSNERIADYIKYWNLENLITIKLDTFLDTASFLNAYTTLCKALHIRDCDIPIEQVEQLHKQWIKTAISTNEYKTKYKLG